MWTERRGEDSKQLDWNESKQCVHNFRVGCTYGHLLLFPALSSSLVMGDKLKARFTPRICKTL